MGCSASTDGGVLPPRGKAPLPAITKTGGTPAPSFLRRMFVGKVVTVPTSKNGKKRSRLLKKNKVAPMPLAPLEKVPSQPKVPKKVTATEMVHELMIEQVNTPEHLVKAGLSVAGGVKPNKFGVQYELADFDRPPSHSYGRPGSRLAQDAPVGKDRSRLDRFKLRDEHAVAMIAKEERRKKVLEERIARAHRSVERVEKVREAKVNSLLEEASLTMTDLVQKEQGKKATRAWTLEDSHPRPPAPFRPPSRSTSSHKQLLHSTKDVEAAQRSLRREAMIKEKQADMARQQAQEAKLAGVRLIKVRSEQSRERRRKFEEQKRAALNAKKEKTVHAADLHQQNLEDVKERAERDLKRVRRLTIRKAINKQCGDPFYKQVPDNCPHDLKELHDDWWDCNDF